MKEHKMTAGFTLVELIVVIAILGILAGVGTVGYSGYIKKANQAKDIQMVSQIKNALEIAGYDSSANLQDGTIKLSKTAEPDISDPSIKDALVKVYGSEEAVKALTLSYDWEVDETVYNAVATNYVGSTFDGIESNLLSDVQALTDRFKEFTDQAGELESYAGPNFTNYLTSIGAESTNPQQVANAAATYVASRTQGLSESDFLAKWTDPSTIAGGPYGFGSITTTTDAATLGMMGGLAALYARGEAFVNYLDSKQTGSTAFTDPYNGETYDSLSSWFSAQQLAGTTTNAVADSVGDLYTKVCTIAQSDSKYSSLWNGYFSDGTAEKDGKAYLAAMGAINNSAGVLTSDLDNNALYTDGKAENLLISYIASASHAADGTVVISGQRNANGAYVAIAIPGDV